MRSPIMALIMFCIPFVNLYLLYKWLVEYKEKTSADYNPIVQFILWCIPIVNLYFIWKFMGDLEAKAKGVSGYPLGATIFLIISILIGIPLIYFPYKTQELLNAL
jgi:hypothetical protein